MPKVLFWNVQRKQLDGHVLSLVATCRPDILVLIEFPAVSLLPALLPAEGLIPVSGSGRFGVFARPEISLVREADPAPTDRVDYWRVLPAGADDWLMVVLHGPDRRNAEDATRAIMFRRVADHARFLERHAGHRRTVILGDFNANPFEASVLGTGGFHALGVRQVRRQFDRTVKSHGRADFFYNPMWRMYGTDPDGDAGSGTYYYRKGDQATEPFWHMLDQVLIRPEVADRMPAAELRILAAAAAEPLLDVNGLPAAKTASDHLPVAFVLN